VDLDSLAGLAGLLVIPGLFGLPMLMAWMETRFTEQLVAREVETAWESSLGPEEIEDAIRTSVARLFPAH
jgi:hypothetical protein